MKFGAAIFALVALSACRSDKPASAPSVSPKLLSHSAVEQYITANLGASSVICNHGEDFRMTSNGQTFTCAAGGGLTFTVTITDKDAGSYKVS